MIYRHLEFEELSSSLRARLDEGNFLHACESANMQNTIVWMMDGENGIRIELEWDPNKNDFLESPERLAMFRSPYQVDLQEAAVYAKICHLLDPNEGSLKEEVSVFSLDDGVEIFKFCQDVYSPVRIDVKDLIKRKLEDVGFPRLYATWSSERKIEYWVSSLYRLRRATGERGIHEDETFGIGILERMRQVDPHINRILRDVINELARMERLDSTELARAFEIRTGVKF